MKKLLCVLTLCLLAACSNKAEDKVETTSVASTTQNVDMETAKEIELYKEIVKDFKTIALPDLVDDKFETNAVIYVGRETCPYCRQLAPFLKTMTENAPDVKFFYVDVEQFRGKDILKKAAEKYNLPGVPYLMYIDENFNVTPYDNQVDLVEWANSFKK